jgi:bifunctional non-homologous end joining protein LigD
MKAFSQAVAESIAAEAPDRYTSHMSKIHRKGKIFIDYLRNSRGATAVAAYSTRARRGAPVSLPVAWTELSRLRREQFTVETVPRRLSASARDPWKDFLSARQSVTRAARRALGLP